MSYTTADHQRAAKLIGPEKVASFGKLGVCVLPRCVTSVFVCRFPPLHAAEVRQRRAAFTACRRAKVRRVNFS